MSKKVEENETLEELIIQLNGLLNEIKIEQKNLKKTINTNHKVNMQKFAKLIDYSEISDMTNTIFERRIASIEKLLYEVFKS